MSGSVSLFQKTSQITNIRESEDLEGNWRAKIANGPGARAGGTIEELCD